MPHQDFSGLSGLAGDRPSHPAGARRALDQLFCVTYEELRRLASTVKRGDPSITLSPTALVNEAWLKMAKSPYIAAESPLHFKRIAARAMRQLLVEAARRRHSGKRGGNGEAIFVTFDDSLNGVAACEDDLLALDSALAELAHFEPRQAAIVESRFFGGLEINEISSLLGVSEATILRDWRAAKAWLGQKLKQPR
jgi:RNA polymerase sigma factor (TIGR02999 family)